MAEEARQRENDRLQRAIEEQERREREQREKEEQVNQVDFTQSHPWSPNGRRFLQLRREKEEQERRAAEEAEKKRLELEEKLRKEEEERLARKKRIEEIMARTRGGKPTPAPAPSTQNSIAKVIYL